MRIFSLLFVWLFIAVIAGAQESRPTKAPTTQKTAKTKVKTLTTDPAALKSYQKITSALYRPRDHGLKAVQFHFVVKIALPDGRKMEYGPYNVDWDVKKGRKVTLVGEWEKGMIKPEQMSPNFLEEMINDFVGWETENLTKGRHVTFGDKKQIVVTLPTKEKSMTPIRKIILVANKAGRLGSQSVLGEKDYPLMSREYDYVSGHKRALVENVRVTSGETKKVKSHSYVELGEYTFPQKITSIGVEQGTRDVVYSSIRVPKKAKK